jgi:SPX domain protein involved in polyphosphate accumulation
MKFAKYLETQSIPEWRKAYIDYKSLKKKLKVIEKVRKRCYFECRSCSVFQAER